MASTPLRCITRNTTITPILLQSIGLYNVVFRYMPPCIIRIQCYKGTIRISAHESIRGLIPWLMIVFLIWGVGVMGCVSILLYQFITSGLSTLPPWVIWSSLQTVFLVLLFLYGILIIGIYTSFLVNRDACEAITVLQKIENECT